MAREGGLLVMGWNRVLELMVYEISEQFIKPTIRLGVKVFFKIVSRLSIQLVNGIGCYGDLVDKQRVIPRDLIREYG